MYIWTLNISVVIVLPVGEIKEENFVDGKEAPKHIGEQGNYFIPQNFPSFEIMMIEDLNVQKINQFIFHNLVILWLFTVRDFSFEFSFPFNVFIVFSLTQGNRIGLQFKS